MKIKEIKLSVKELANGYVNDGESGVFAYNGNLVVRPSYQRNFIYNDKQRNAVIETILEGTPLNNMYWAVRKDGKYEIIDGQQRTISICQYINGDFSYNDNYYHTLPNGKTKDKIDNYVLTIYLCDGTEEEKLAYFRRINIQGAVMTEQELRNSSYCGSWLESAKKHFSKIGCVGAKVSDGYVKKNVNRQELLETALEWVCNRDNLAIEQYMAKHQNDVDCNDLWQYFQQVMSWAKMLFPNVRKGITDCQDWGILYNEYHSNIYNTNELESSIVELIADDDVENNKGIIPYLLSGKEKHLHIRSFSDNQKRKKYEEQSGICPICNKTFTFDEMEGDHIVAWTYGGKTIYENLQMLCKECNRTKGAR